MARGQQHHLVLLPGLDGSGRLFAPFLSLLPSTFEASVVRFPADRPASERELFGCIREVIPWDHSYVIVAESSAGPLALRYALAQQQGIRALVLCASFVSNPLKSTANWATSLFSKPWLDQVPTPQVLRKHLLGEDAPEILLSGAAETFGSIPQNVWTARAQAIMNVDVRRELQACDKPILYLQAAHDQFVTSASMEEILRLNPNVKVAAVPSPHAILQRQPRAAIEAIRSFLEALADN